MTSPENAVPTFNTAQAPYILEGLHALSILDLPQAAGEGVRLNNTFVRWAGLAESDKVYMFLKCIYFQSFA